MKDGVFAKGLSFEGSSCLILSYGVIWKFESQNKILSILVVLKYRNLSMRDARIKFGVVM